MRELFNFDVYQTSLRRYGGSDKKAAIKIGDDFYMLKFNDRISSEKRNEFNSSYRNSAVSEYISCHIIESFGLPVQETILGTREGKLVVACKGFCVNGNKLNEFSKYESAGDIVLDRYPDIYDVLTITELDTSLPFEKAEKRFWDTFVCDAILGNFDRHTGNWGFLYNDQTNSVTLAPIYDCGACLYPMINDNGMEAVLSQPDEIDKRIYDFPASVFTVDHKRISYSSFLNSCEDEACLKSIIDIYRKIDINKINDIIDNTPTISELRKHFYKTMILQRVEKIIEPAYKRAVSLLLPKDKFEDKVFAMSEWAEKTLKEADPPLIQR